MRLMSMGALFSRSRRRWANSLAEESLEAAGTIYWHKAAVAAPCGGRDVSVNGLHAPRRAPFARQGVPTAAQSATATVRQ
jgi:hypothetical protein